MGRSLPHCSAEKTEQEGVFCSDSVFIGMLRHITHATARPVTYGVLLSGILTSHLITSVMNCLFSHDATKIQTTKLSILLIFYFHKV